MKCGWRERVRNDVRVEFAKMRAEFAGLADEAGLSLARARSVDQVGKVVKGRAGLLRDTLLNYIMAEAVADLEGYPASVRNSFHNLRVRARIIASFSPNAPTFEPSLDRRWLTGGVPATVVAAAGLTATGIGKGGLALSMVTGFGAVLASGVVFYVGYRGGAGIARRHLVGELDAYFARTEDSTWEWLTRVERQCVGVIDDFARRHDIGGTPCQG